MAEVLGVTASAVGVIGFAGQLAQSAAFCYNFFKDSRDAPKDVEQLMVELRDVTALLQGVAAIYSPRESPDADLERALRQCEQAIKSIEKALRAVKFSSSLKKGRRWWRQMKAALKRPGLAKLLESLGRSKATLVQACMNNSRMAAATHFRVSQDMKARLSILAQDQTDGNDLAFETKTIVSGIETRTAEMYLSLSRDSEITAQTQARVIALERMTTEFLDQRSRTEDVNLIPTDPRHRERLISNFANEISRNVIHDIRLYPQKTYLEGLSSANLSTSESHCQCDGHPNRATPENTSACSTNLPIKKDIFLQKHGNPGSRAEDKWLRLSRSTTSRCLISNRLLGTLKLQTTLTTYSRRSSKDLCQARNLQQIWHTKITYMPSRLGSQGTVVRYSPWKAVGDSEYFVPSFNIGLSTFNIREYPSEIFQACCRLDVDKIQDLFDRGLASPFDVDQNGRNLLGWTFTRGLERVWANESPEQMLSSFEEIIDMLISFGVDGSHLEKTDACGEVQNAVSLYLSVLSDMVSARGNWSQDRLQLILEKILVNAESDPFDDGNDGSVLLEVDSEGNYTAISYPTCFTASEYLQCMPKAYLETLVREEYWSIPWSALQVPVLCSLGLFRGRTDDPGGPSLYYWIGEHVRFWVTSTHGEVEVHLKAKSTLLQKILRKQGTAHGLEWAIDLLHSTIHDGAETIALFTEHDYHGQGAPWVRHRTKKLVLIRAFLVDTMEVILTNWWHELDVLILDQLDKHATRHNLRIVSIWKQALGNARRGFQRRAVETSIVLPQQQESFESTAGVLDECPETESVWETDQSDEYFSAEESMPQEANDTDQGWETEEEWEEGYLLDKAVDVGRPDDKNTQLRDSERHTCQPDMYDFDKQYWSHVCDQIHHSICGKPAAPPEQGMLKGVASAAAGYLTGALW